MPGDCSEIKLDGKFAFDESLSTGSPFPRLNQDNSLDQKRQQVEFEALLAGPFAKSRWFTRCWTLQELIAPKTVSFYGSAWNFLGTKVSLTALISTITGVDRTVLYAFGPMSSLGEICVARKMSWAANRQTSRVEDEAYCLLGLFGVNMPLLYGEGRAAFTRLQEESIKSPMMKLYSPGMMVRDQMAFLVPCLPHHLAVSETELISFPGHIPKAANHP